MTASVGTLADFLLARIAESEEYWRARRPREIDRQSIDQVLTDCEAKRRIVDECRNLLIVDKVYPGEAGGEAASVILGHLALPYADHPSYRDEWRP